jgi:dTDP-4-amino-4,6-dideoxygalactose transaminase
MIGFVERKDVDWVRVQRSLRLSEAANQWSNFGPVCLELERQIARQLGLARSLAVVATASGTAAVFALVQLHEHMAGRPLRWAVSSYGFPSSVMGPLREARVVDCTAGGLLDLDQVAGVDGLVVTNPFGLYPELEEHRQYCRDRGLALIVDSCGAFDAVTHGPGEALSFHHTKPWGFGEGGCMIVPRELEELARSVIHLGLWHGLAVGRRALNGKLSDVGAAFIAQRLDVLPRLSAGYRAQYERIVRVAAAVGFCPLGGVARFPGTPVNVPLLSPRPLPSVANDLVTLAKYYRPLAPTPVATGLYERVVNVPCHAELAELDDAGLAACLRALLAVTPRPPAAAALRG